MKASNKIIILFCILLSGCATTTDPLTVEAQKSFNRDYTMVELAKISALVEIVKTTDDSNVKIQAINALNQMQKKTLPQPDKAKYWFER